MTKREIATIVAHRIGIRVYPDAYAITREVFEVIAEKMAEGHTVTIAGFGEFTSRQRPGYVRPNFEGGLQPRSAPVKVPHLRWYKTIKDLLNGREK